MTAPPHGQPCGTGEKNNGIDRQMKMTDMKAMCDIHRKMMSANTPEERRAMMNEHMKNMPPEMIEVIMYNGEVYRKEKFR